MKNSAKALLIIGIAITLLFASCSFIDDNFVWDNGMRYLCAYSGDDYGKQKYNYSSQILPNTYSVEIDLNDPDSNIGKEIYKNGLYSIYIDSIEPYDAERGGYRIAFYSHGIYGLFGGKLISAMNHPAPVEGTYLTDFHASLTAIYNGQTYLCSLAERSALLRNDGDFFVFTLFPQEAYENGEIPTENIGNVTITISNLVESKWTRKIF